MIPVISSRSGRFSLRPFSSNDVIALVHHINSSNIAARVSNVPYPYTEEHAKDWLHRLEEERVVHKYKRRIDYTIDIDGELVGSIALINVDGHKAQLSYWLGEAHQGKGIMSEAVECLVMYGKFYFQFFRIWAYTYENNLASQAVLTKVQTFYDRSTSFKCEFTQEFFVKAYNQKKTSKGKVTFSKPGKMEWIYDEPKDNRVVSDGTTPVQGFVSYKGTSLIFTPNTLLKPNTRYTVTLKGSLGGISDLSGNAMNNDFIISWTTGTTN